MSDIFCVTNRKLCCGDFLAHMEEMAGCRPAGIILREKDLSDTEYEALARLVMDMCRKNGILCVLHSHVRAACELEAPALHVTLPVLRKIPEHYRRGFTILGASCHSIEDAVEAKQLGCSYVTAGHVFDTDCKKGTPGKGLDFLKQVCKAVDIPVYAIGGISPGNIAEVRAAGAKGACVMSGCMESGDVRAFLNSFGERDA
ncbi:MAG: thiamine phosphate synthase [Clostridiales bacterium]|nr:thiamine phosphate synthase [Clostridiales bacterium]